MKGKKLLAGMLSAAMVLGTMAMPAFADDSTAKKPNWTDNSSANVVVYGIGENGDDVYEEYLEDALNDIYKLSPTEPVTIECKQNAELNVTNGGRLHIADDINIIGNGAKLTGISFEIDWYSYNRQEGMYAKKGSVVSSGKENCEYLTKDISFNIDNLSNVDILTTRNTAYNVSINLKNCENVKEVYITEIGNGVTTGNTNISLNNCSFAKDLSRNDVNIYSNYSGNIEIENCEFSNIQEPIKLNNKSAAEQTVAIKNSTFTDCGLGDIETGAPISFRTVNGSAITNATIEGCTFAYSNEEPNTGDVLIGTVKDGKDCTPNVTATISGNTNDVDVVSSKSASADEQIKNTVPANETATVEMDAVAAINGVKYATLKDAVTAAQNGDTITIIGKVAVNDSTDDMRNKTLTIKGDPTNGADELTFVNGVGGEASNGYYIAEGANLTFKDLTITWKDCTNFQGLIRINSATYNNCTINGMLTLYGNSEKFNGCTFVQKADNEWAHNIWTWGATESEFTNCVFRCRGKSINVYGGGESTTKDAYLAAAAKKLTIDGCEFYVEDKVENCDASAIMIKTRECPYDINIKNSTATGFVTGKMSGQQLYDIEDMRTDVDATEERTTVKINDAPIDLEAVKEAIRNGSTTPSEAKPVLKIAFVKNDAASDEESHVYDIKVVSGSDINELNTAELTFDFETDKANEYTITPAEDIVLTGDNANANHYMFSFKNGDVRKTDQEITIGQATVTGYGKYTLKVDDTAVSVVNATTLAANLVDTYATDGSADGKLDVADSTTDVNGDKQEIRVPTRKLAVKISMNNKVEDQKKSYQDMKVEIAGGDYTETIALGSDALAQINKVYTVERELPINTAYTVTISGAGYRTARYTVNLTENKTLNFWNNVAENAIEVELGNDTYKKDVTFLAGDIVKDNNINIYDLSAVVSYFGTDNLVDEHPEYAKYDLNRDGKIDSKDVAYVLVSWDK